ncbi:hypothetical protein AHF37_07186 [Paragonimus kellicotti]|nr:hypothetical protein AHF37_07186 [Paragonimus kellicotti]
MVVSHHITLCHKRNVCKFITNRKMSHSHSGKAHFGVRDAHIMLVTAAHDNRLFHLYKSDRPVATISRTVTAQYRHPFAPHFVSKR